MFYDPVKLPIALLSFFACFFLPSGAEEIHAKESGVSKPGVLWIDYPCHFWSDQNASINLREEAPFASAFLKQLRRQALLLAAREELGVSTRDAFLNETAPEGAATVKDVDRFLVETIGAVDGLFAQDVDHRDFLTRLESLSRNELVVALQPIVPGRNRPSAEAADEFPENEKEAIEKLFYRYDIVSQFEAVRRTHAAIRRSGETPVLLGMLVRGYTQMQLLTNASFRDTHRVFQARSMLYAQRLTAKYGETPETQAVRAAAWSLNNFHRLARTEFAALPADSPQTDWIRLARLYADFDLRGIDALIESEPDNPERKWAKLLKFNLLAYTNNGKKAAAPYGKEILGEFTDCPRLYLNLFAFEDFFSPTMPDGTGLQEHWARQIAPSLRGMEGMPINVAAAAQELRKSFSGRSGGGLLGLFFGGKRRPEQPEVEPDDEMDGIAGGKLPPEFVTLLQAMNESDPGTDEPSFQMAATLLQDEIFFAVTLCALRQGNPDLVIASARPAIDTHPLMNHLGLACNDAGTKEEFVQRFKKTRIPYEMLSLVRLGFDFSDRDLWTRGNYLIPYFFGMRFGDRENVRDVFAYHQELRWQIGRNTPAFTVDLLAELCPENPFAAAECLARKETVETDRADEYFKKFSGYLNFLEAARDYYLKIGKQEKAIEAMRALHDADVNTRAWRQIFQLLLEQGDIDVTIAYLRDILENSKGDSSEPWRFNAAYYLGALLFAEGKIKEAESWLQMMPQGYAMGRYYPLSMYYEACGKFDKAHEFGELDAQMHYANGPRRWATCFRTNDGRLAEVTDRVFETFQQQRKERPSDAKRFYQLYYISYCMGLPMKDLFGADPSVRVFFEYENPVAGFLAFFEALESQNTVKADALLRLLQDRGSLVGRGDLAQVTRQAKLPLGTGTPRITKPAFRMLAAVFSLDRRSETPGSLNPEIVQTLLRAASTDRLQNEDALYVLYFLGRYYMACGHRDKALDCYRRVCAARSLEHFFPVTFAVKEMRDEGLSTEDYLDWIRSDAEFPAKPASGPEREEFTQQLFDALNLAESSLLTTLSESETIFEVRRSDYPVTDIFPGGWTTWKFPSAKLVRKLEGRSYYSAWSRDGKRIAVGSEKYLAGLWDPVTGEDLGGVRRTPDARGSALAFVPGSKSILFGGTDGFFGLWTPKRPGDAEPDWRKREHPWVSGIAASPDGRTYCTVTENDAERGVFLWDLRTGKLLHAMKDHKQGVFDAAFFSKGNRLVTVSRDKTAFIYNTRTGRPRLSLQGHKELIRTVAVSPDDRIIATGSDDDTVMLWDAETGNPIKTLGMFHGDVISLAFSPDGTKLAVGRNYNGETTHILDTKSWEPVMIVPGHGFWNCKMAWSPDSRQLVTCGEDTRLWDVSSDEEAASSETTGDAALPDRIHLKDLQPKQCMIGSLTEPEFKKFRSSRKEYSDALWAHAPSRVSYDLGGKWKTFKTLYGIRIGAHMEQASCFFIVLGDGKILFRSELIRDNLDRPLELNVENVKTLELIVDPNRNNFNDHGVWYDPTLIR